MTFLDRFDAEWAPRLRHRSATFRRIFEYLLAHAPGPCRIVETGCARAESWEGDGQSTLLFDRFVAEYGGEVVSVDADEGACAFARGRVGERTRVVHGQSVPFLDWLRRELARDGGRIDLLYLDSLDCDFRDPTPSAVHHLQELCAIAPALSPGTLVVVDDAYRSLVGAPRADGSVDVLHDLGIGGKGTLIAQYFERIGRAPLFEGYQCGWEWR